MKDNSYTARYAHPVNKTYILMQDIYPITKYTLLSKALLTNTSSIMLCKEIYTINPVTQ